MTFSKTSLFIIYCYCLFFSFDTNGQNLIPNPSFEIINGLKAKDWKHLPDNFHHYEVREDIAYNGRAIQGICLSNFSNSEWLLVELKEELKSNTSYCFKIHAFNKKINRSDLFNEDSMQEFHLMFSDIPVNSNGMIEGTLPDTAIKRLHISQVENKNNWFEITTEYRAKGNEKYLHLGFFGRQFWDNYRELMEAELFYDDKKDLTMANGKGGKQKKKKKKNQFEISDPNHYRARYYFDEICLASIGTNGKCNCNPEILINATTKPEKTQEFVLPGVQFKSASAELTEKAKIILDSLALVIMGNPENFLKIHGHTDDTGDSLTNWNLSIDRALSVKLYLEENGVLPEKMESNGFGDLYPIDENQNEEGRKKNRRVEFLIWNKTNTKKVH